MKWGRTGFRAVLGAALCSFLVISGCSGKPEVEKIEVSPEQQTTWRSVDGGVTVEIPGSSVD
ncbi:MAG: hypothetical protein LPK23_10290, partial [Rhodococcus sp. (in: high G+C Gram-positive bacteria)]|nr:hypothetical protein [Rhodococcus sp. (in: high G+C Gram-positive bacteria)]MDX5454162.1 hypothetical protein [Rhodococcus sp. (in: high G+C Gram-positive bacteria)]